MRSILTRASVLAVSAALGACATTKEELLPHGRSTMADIWEQHSAGATRGDRVSRRLVNARTALRRPLDDNEQPELADASSYTRTAATEIERQFRRLPNPDLVMYVFPHLSGSEAVPVPGYSTVFPLYERFQYALPGERIDAY